jgi:hypothetical protein
LGQYQVRLLGALSIPLAETVSLDLTVNPRFFAYTGRGDGQVSIRGYNEAELGWQAAAALRPKFVLGHQTDYRRSGSTKTIESEQEIGVVGATAIANVAKADPLNVENKLILTLGADVVPVKGVTITPAVNQTVSLNNGSAANQAFGLFRESQTNFSLEFNAAF